MASTSRIRANRAFVELFADDSKLVRGLRRAEKRLRVFGAKVRNLGLKLTGPAKARWDCRPRPGQTLDTLRRSE